VMTSPRVTWTGSLVQNSGELLSFSVKFSEAPKRQSFETSKDHLFSTSLVWPSEKSLDVVVRITKASESQSSY
jgi:hypothetical protein